MGLCHSATHKVAITVEEMWLDPPFERDILKGLPVVYLKQGEKLLNFTTVVPQVVDVTGIWNQTRYIELEPKDPDKLEFVVGENPRYRGTLSDLRKAKGEILVEVEEFEGNNSQGSVGTLRIEVTQNAEAAPAPPMPKRTFSRPGFVANLSVFLYEGYDLHRSLIKNRKEKDLSAMSMEVDLALYTPEESVRTPNRLKIDKRSFRKGKKFCPVWNEGFHWQNLTEEPRFLDVRFNGKSEDESVKATARIDLLLNDVWSKGQDWKWHPVLADDRHDQKFYRILLVDDSDDGPELKRVLEVLSCDPSLETSAEDALDMLFDQEYSALIEKFELMFVNIRQKAGMDGITFVQRIREAERKLNLRPMVIIGTDYPFPQSDAETDRRILQAQEINDILYKPVQKADVRWLLQRFIRNMGNVLLDIVVTYTPVGSENALRDAHRARLAEARRALQGPPRRFGSIAREAEELETGATDEQGALIAKPVPELNGLLELRIERISLKNDVPENYTLVYIVTMNHTMLETNIVKRTREEALPRNDPIEWNEEVRLWISNKGEDGSGKLMNLGIAVYAYPSGNQTWSSEDLVGQWVSSDMPPGREFWSAVNGQYIALLCPLRRASSTGELKKQGVMEIRAIVRPAPEIAQRELHDAYVSSCSHSSLVSRGEIDRLMHRTIPLVTPPDVKRRVRGQKDDDGELKLHDDVDAEENVRKLEDLQGDVEDEDDDDQFKEKMRYRHDFLNKLDRFVRDSAHYTPNGQTAIDEVVYSHFVDMSKVTLM